MSVVPSKKSNWQLATDREHIHAIGEAFLGNPRMKALVGRPGKALQQGVKHIVKFAYFMVKKWEGIYISKQRNTYLLYYRQRDYHFSLRDVKHYLQIAWQVIGLRRLWSVLQRERFIKQTRKAKIQAEQDKDYLYVWLLAQRREENSLVGLVESKQFILQLSRRLGLPLYMETTEKRLVKMYQRCGFQFYDSFQDPITQMTVWFGRYTPNGQAY